MQVVKRAVNPIPGVVWWSSTVTQWTASELAGGAAEPLSVDVVSKQLVTKRHSIGLPQRLYTLLTRGPENPLAR
jgi:hypothetical protein